MTLTPLFTLDFRERETMYVRLMFHFAAEIGPIVFMLIVSTRNHGIERDPWSTLWRGQTSTKFSSVRSPRKRST